MFRLADLLYSELKPPKPSKVALFSLDKIDWIYEAHAIVLAQLRAASEVIEITTKEVALAFLREDNHHVPIIATDPQISDEDSAELGAQIRAFVKEGGTIIYGFQAPSLSQFPDLERM